MANETTNTSAKQGKGPISELGLQAALQAYTRGGYVIRTPEFVQMDEQIGGGLLHSHTSVVEETQGEWEGMPTTGYEYIISCIPILREEVPALNVLEYCQGWVMEGYSRPEPGESPEVDYPLTFAQQRIHYVTRYEESYCEVQTVLVFG